MYSTGQTFKLKRGFYADYKKAHDDLWPQMAEALQVNQVNIVIHHYHDRLYMYATAPSREHFERVHAGADAQRWLCYMATMMETDEQGKSIIEQMDLAFSFGAFK